MAAAEPPRIPTDQGTSPTTDQGTPSAPPVSPPDNPKEPVVTDFDMSNLLYINYRPPVSNPAAEDDLVLLEKELQAWKAWESANCEQQVLAKVTSKDLPADLSLQSKWERMSYRAKVTDIKRERSPW